MSNEPEDLAEWAVWYPAKAAESRRVADDARHEVVRVSHAALTSEYDSLAERAEKDHRLTAASPSAGDRCRPRACGAVQ